MKIAYKGLIFMICLNMSVYLNQQMGYDFRGTTSVTPTELTDQFNPTTQVTSWGGWFTTVAIVGDIVSGLQMVWTTIQTFVVGFPVFLSDLGAPTEIVNVLYAIWSFIWVVFVWEFISGRIMSRD